MLRCSTEKCYSLKMLVGDVGYTSIVKVPKGSHHLRVDDTSNNYLGNEFSLLNMNEYISRGFVRLIDQIKKVDCGPALRLTRSLFQTLIIVF